MSRFRRSPTENRDMDASMSRNRIVRRALRLHGQLPLPGDKSISHRALIFGALGTGRCRIEGLARGEDVRSTVACLRSLGVAIEEKDDAVTVTGAGLQGLQAPGEVLDCGNSGTTMRLLAGVLAGAGLSATLDGDAGLRRRPMRRVVEPLRRMGAAVAGETPMEAAASKDATTEESYAPLVFAERRGPLQGMEHRLSVASAQVKTALLLAGLWAEGETRVIEPVLSRDHSERMLQAFGASIVRDGRSVSIRQQRFPLRPPSTLQIPGDPSSAAFLVGAALLVPGGTIELRGVDLNPTRVGWLTALLRMGARVEVVHTGEEAGDPVGTIRAQQGPLVASEIEGAEIPSMVDEIPLLAVVATQARGRTVIRGAGELRVKESDRLAQIAAGLRALGGRVEELEDGLVIDGPSPLQGATVGAAGDHRIAMSLAVAGLAAWGETRIEGAAWADVSYPGFFDLLEELTA